MLLLALTIDHRRKWLMTQHLQIVTLNIGRFNYYLKDPDMVNTVAIIIDSIQSHKNINFSFTMLNS